MKHRLTLTLTLVIVLVAGAVFGADGATFKVVTPYKQPRAAKGTGVQGTISVGVLPTQLQQLTCNDLVVHVGTLHSGGQAVTSFSSSRATGSISSGQCSYHVNSRLPAGGPFDVVIVQEPARDKCKLSDNHSLGRVTLTRGATSELNAQLTPVCEAN